MPLLVAPFHSAGHVVFAMLLGLYLTCAVLFSLHIGSRHGFRYALVMPGVFFLIHVSYGFGSIYGLSQCIGKEFGRRVRGNH